MLFEVDAASTREDTSAAARTKGGDKCCSCSGLAVFQGVLVRTVAVRSLLTSML